MAVVDYVDDLDIAVLLPKSTRQRGRHLFHPDITDLREVVKLDNIWNCGLSLMRPRFIVCDICGKKFHDSVGNRLCPSCQHAD